MERFKSTFGVGALVGVLACLAWLFLTWLSPKHIVLLSGIFWGILVFFGVIVVGIIKNWRGRLFFILIGSLLVSIASAIGAFFGIDLLVFLGFNPDLVSQPTNWLLYPTIGLFVICCLFVFVFLFFLYEVMYSFKEKLGFLADAGLLFSGMVSGFALLYGLSCLF